MCRERTGMSRKKQILVIDDEAIVRASCQRTLEPAGFAVDMAPDGLEGIKMLKRKKYDLVLTDLKMPNMDGLEFSGRIAKEHPDTRVMLITGYSTLDTAINAREKGIYYYLEKPFTPDRLLEAINEALGDEPQ